jgi:hypothetical protein
MCAVIEQLKPEVLSFQYGLPDAEPKGYASWAQR